MEKATVGGYSGHQLVGARKEPGADMREAYVGVSESAFGKRK